MRKHTDDLLATRVTLMARLKDWQDQAAWQEFFDTYWRLIYGVARKSGLSDADAQDVVSQTMESAAKHMPNFQYDPARGSFKAWLLNKTRWLIIDRVRKRDRFPVDARATETGSSRTRTVEKVADTRLQTITQLFEADWEQGLYDAALANIKRRVDPQKYQIFDFYVRKEWPAEKVAATFGVSVELVHTAKSRITKLIKDEVNRLQRDTR